jgi:hypothetical protein
MVKQNLPLTAIDEAARLGLLTGDDGQVSD